MLSNTLVLAALGLAALASAQEPCGLKVAPCPTDKTCVPNAGCPNPKLCPGTCRFKNKYDSCGGKTVSPRSCKPGFECRDDPRLPESCGLACDVPGICLPKEPKRCGGFAGFACPKGLYCYYGPLTGCDPKTTSDCMGICL
ncbi:uncharacterized protein UV8b_00843 [Ustilaginoidea virens]|uniref:Uncharacterized protein n=1 Tax=Ustilaginoidea virens TaxID=1159556 RepID=A0A063BT85_USTVR|nr:uncharacterized protein UV8b_00843 [Ustilaginoidea virens]QUC16602.1 hypothetical protein UV8b_00843 [Ustilaginoidea virens]GAO18545.1 hypothetical protein UVI_02012210 [Ustilaginoidea virens]